MENYTMVLTEHLNHNGKLFGGQLLKWVDEFAWIAAISDYRHSILVTRAMEKIEFKKTVVPGSVLRFSIRRSHTGTTSVTYAVEVYAREPDHDGEELIFSNLVTFCAVDAEGKKTPLPAPEGKPAVC